MGRVGRQTLVQFGVVLLVAVVSLLVDQTTGDTTGPPYHDPLINQIAFFVFLASILTLIVLVVATSVRLVRSRPGKASRTT